ncbi:hypothetical protein HK104_003834 [Borealophlyctis nickersoniae]|nr:hypothetical protein HK104_003834 [Borealophlyctis nickersoniae]
MFQEGLGGWTVVKQAGSRGDVVVGTAGKFSPVSGRRIPELGVDCRVRGRVAVLDTGSSPGSYVLYQEIRPVTGDVLSFHWAVVNRAPDFHVDGRTMSASMGANQQFRVDLVEISASEWFSVINEDLVVNILPPETVQTIMDAIGRSSGSALSPWQRLQYDLSPFAGRKLLLAFRAVGTVGQIMALVDDVRIRNDGCTSKNGDAPRTEEEEEVREVVVVEGGPDCADACKRHF